MIERMYWPIQTRPHRLMSLVIVFLLGNWIAFPVTAQEPEANNKKSPDSLWLTSYDDAVAMANERGLPVFAYVFDEY